MTTGNREDYIINILRLTEGKGVVKTTELASFMNVSPASVSEMLKVLSEEGLVNYEKYRGVSLTEKGMQSAKNLRLKHHIMERFFVDVLDKDHASAHTEACAIEHSISDESANKMCRMMGTKVDSDCEVCTNPCHGVRDTSLPTISLVDMELNDTGVISHLICNDSNKIKKLISMGFVPGRTVKIETKLSSKGPRIVKIGDSVIAIDRDMSTLIQVDIGGV